MNTLFRGKDFITTQEWSKEELETVFELSNELKMRFALGEPTDHLLRSKTIFMMFFEQSTRTRNSIEAGITQLGGHAHDLTPDKMQLSHGESAKDTAIVLSRFGHAIAIRNCFFGIGNNYMREVAKYADVPVINLQDDFYHPLQGLADLMTIKEKCGNDLRNIKVTISWAYATSHAKPLSVPQTQALLFTRYGMDVTIAHPKEFPLMPELMKQAKQNAEKHGGSLKFTNDMDEAFDGAQIVIPKNWGGFLGVEDPDTDEGKKQMKENLEKHKDWICDERRMSLADKDVLYMHAMPADRGKEVTDSVIDGPHSIIYDEAENRLHTAKAIMALTMGGRP
ncbi:aspartate/ornithine carbamoyltransferase carbamoyl-P binding domain [Petrotoga mobilis SJ95]|jgi:ornithine carbamoyltransferase|uniref:Aspartate/ornithine carbamoyltransferase carbamoyl-P binding domain n=1 Tax=Petrotoga mobilis (strain DSM 10674 / SJ95) TaxID=403833 RepID=A9BIT6_PETMO|nr:MULTISPECIES: ornithine carbamoyltransferase [Petrotoga]ABX32424.1 aspartate/ornithine carbamoyltransferase carbamoyl-P binding domain [Petrotoga mobilis SJ95]PNR87737.1 ornithine carbamoyltransferase [Petrotoga sp. 9T1HF07.CasAA.8.2]